MPRSGTRQFTDFLNRSSKFHLEGELFDEVDAAVSLVEKVFRRQLKYLKSFPDFKDPHQQSIATNTFERRRREMLVYLVNFLSKSTEAQSQADIIYALKLDIRPFLKALTSSAYGSWRVTIVLVVGTSFSFTMMLDIWNL